MATTVVYGKFFEGLFDKKINLITATIDTLNLMLTTSTYAPNQDTHKFKSDVTNEVSGTGYTAAGSALASVGFAYTASTNTWALTSNAVSWTTATITARYAVCYDVTSGAADTSRILLFYVDFTADFSSTAGTFSVTPNAAGWFTIVIP